MSSGLQRRRVASTNTSAANLSVPTSSPAGISSPSAPSPDLNASFHSDNATLSSENGHRIAFDPRDLQQGDERSKQPRLTLMEEILLMGLKDKQV